MTTPEKLEEVLRDFICECERHDDSDEKCTDCIYWDICARFYTPHCECPDEWTLYDKVSPIPS